MERGCKKGAYKNPEGCLIRHDESVADRLQHHQQLNQQSFSRLLLSGRSYSWIRSRGHFLRFFTYFFFSSHFFSSLLHGAACYSNVMFWLRRSGCSAIKLPRTHQKRSSCLAAVASTLQNVQTNYTELQSQCSPGRLFSRSNNNLNQKKKKKKGAVGARARHRVDVA